MMRVGLGVDIHSFQEGRPCILGGVTIPHSKGLKGHSDADVLVHAVMDSLLGAVGERDIGHFFPDTDVQWKNANSLKMLTLVGEILKKKKTTIHNLDITIIAQEPKISPHISAMSKNLAQVLHVKVSQISIKATSSEWMGFTGRKEGMIALAVTCLDVPES